ncbi:hypothetical protein [Arthrobacter mobilis]|uniref:hypothetical protein n=1 Tax=Arthrobacter mobilis TaxID=2724944 RepID=UPI00197BB1BF|nr:hypothetical protein [Arthrobacter mobilis]
MAGQVLYEVRKGIAALTLNCPERLNALTPKCAENCWRFSTTPTRKTLSGLLW